MGIFPEDEKIRVSELIKLWVAEGFLKTNKSQSLEEVAECYFRDLVDRNLILVQERNCTGKIETCKIHDLLRDLCIRVAEKEKFFCVLDNDTPRPLHTEHRIIHKGIFPSEESHPEVFQALKSAQIVRSLKWEAGEPSFHSRLLRVLNQNDIIGDASSSQQHTLDAYFQQVNLRYFHYCHVVSTCSLYLASSVSRLWNLQTLKIMGVHEVLIVSSEIWEMPQLRHLEVGLFRLPDPPPSDRLDQQDGFVLQNLQTLWEVENFRMSEEVCKRIPNIKELHLEHNDLQRECGASLYYYANNLGRFHKLESLSLRFSEFQNRRDFVLSLIFPSSLRELLHFCRLHWEDLTMIGLLPHLEVLELGLDSVVGPEWNPVEGQFLRLKYLKIVSCEDLIWWNAESSYFPVLEELVLIGMWKLNEIPSGIGEILTLEIIKFHSCSMSVAFSALKILVEQEEHGNDGPLVEVFFLERGRKGDVKGNDATKGLNKQ